MADGEDVVTKPFYGFVDDTGTLHWDFKSQVKAFISTFKGCEIEVEIRERRKKRSLDQNAYLHAAIKPYADHLGYTVEELKLALLGECFGYHEVKGVQLPIRLHTSKLTTKEFVDLTELMVQKAAEDGVLILYPDEYKAAKAKRAA